jgi:hypothetical protein
MRNQNKNKIMFSLLALVFVAMLVSLVSIGKAEALVKKDQAYTSGKYLGKFYIQFQDRQWHELYIRFVDRADQQALLNKVTFTKDCNEKVTYLTVSLPFDSAKIDSGRIRAYITVDDQFSYQQYTTFNPAQKTYSWHYYNVQTSHEGC